tara:strand:- start:217 stop:600 length:384 start_codon:yes stop_codon:yes gene_type:complete
MYVAFAHLTDGEVSKSEWESIGTKVWGWLKTFKIDVNGDGDLNGDDVVSLLSDCVVPFYDSLNFDEKIEEFCNVQALLASQSWWDDEMSSLMLKDMKELAMADGNFAEGEEKWLEIMAKGFGVPVPA